MSVFESERLLLRPFQASDAAQIEELASNNELLKTTLHIPYPFPEEAVHRWIERCEEKERRGSSYSFAIILKKNSKLLGTITLNIALNHNRGELAYWLGRPFWDKGYATEAAEKVITFAFEELNLNRVWATTMTKNMASKEVMKKLGMKYEGTFVQHVLKWEHFEDLDYFAILKDDYKKLEREE